jgi:hypothetical protein
MVDATGAASGMGRRPFREELSWFSPISTAQPRMKPPARQAIAPAV